MSNIDILRDELIYELNKCFCDDVGQYPECENCKKIRRYMSLISEQVVAGEFDEKAVNDYMDGYAIIREGPPSRIEVALWQHSQQKRISELEPSELLQNEFVQKLVETIKAVMDCDEQWSLESERIGNRAICSIALEPFTKGE